MTIVGSDMSKTAATQAYEEAEVSAEEVDVCELHDCFSANELITTKRSFRGRGRGSQAVEAKRRPSAATSSSTRPAG